MTSRPTWAVIQAGPAYELVAGCPCDMKLQHVLMCDHPSWGIPTVYVLTIAQPLSSLDLSRSLPVSPKGGLVFLFFKNIIALLIAENFICV